MASDEYGNSGAMSEQPKELALTAELRDAATSAVDALARAAQQALLYPAGHPVSEAAFERAETALEHLLSMRDPVMVTASPDGLQLDELGMVDTPAAAGLAREMRKRGIALGRLRSGVTAAELRAFIGLLGAEMSQLEAAGGPSRMLADRQVQHIEVGELDFSRWVRASAAPASAAASETMTTARLDQALRAFLFGGAEVLSDEAYERLLEVLERPEDAAAFLAEAPRAGGTTHTELGRRGRPGVSRGTDEADEAMLSRADVLPETEDRPAAAVAGALQQAYRAMRTHSLDNLPEALGRLAGVVRVLPAHTRSRVYRAPLVLEENEQDVLTEIGKLLSGGECAEIIVPGAQALLAETSAQLERLLNRLAAGGRDADQLLGLVQERLRAFGIPSELYNNTINLLLRRTEQPSLMQAIEEGAVPIPESPLTPALLPGPPDQQRETIEKALSSQETAEARALTLAEVLLHEEDATAYNRLALLAERLVPELADERMFRAAARIVSVLDGQTEEVSESLAWQPLRAEQALEAIRTESLVKRTQEAFDRAGERASGELAEWLAMMGPGGAAFLAKAVLDPRFAHLRDALLASLVKWGDQANPGIEQLLAEFGPRQGGQLVRLLGEAGDKRASRHVRLWLRGDNVERALQGLAVLASAADREAVRVLVETAQRGDRELRMEAVDLLGEAREESAVPVLADLALGHSCPASDIPLRTRAIRALGLLPTPGAERTLEQILEKRPALWAGRLEALRIEAARALGKAATAAAKRALDRWRRQARGPLREACEQALKEALGQ
jgi:hypothetical protein